MATFGDRYKSLINSNPNKKSIPNINPGKVYVSPNTSNKYSDLINLNPNQKSIPNNDPGIVYISPNYNNPYVDLINNLKSLLPARLSPVSGRSTAKIYYVEDGYVVDNYVEVQLVGS
jgi:hypothetical protein